METNNKCREALKELRDIVHDAFWSKDGVVKGDVLNALRRANVALAKPVLNCEVGTAKEQEERYIKLKREHVDRLARCPAVGPSFFFPDSLYWAQMPYEEGGAK